MKIASIKVFDPDLTSKGRDLPDLKMHGDTKEKAPRPDARKHTLEEARPKKQITREEEPSLRKTVLKEHQAKVLEAQLNRIHKALPNPVEDGMEDRDHQQRLESIADLDAWLDEIGLGIKDSEDEFGSNNSDQGSHFAL